MEKIASSKRKKEPETVPFSLIIAKLAEIPKEHCGRIKGKCYLRYLTFSPNGRKVAYVAKIPSLPELPEKTFVINGERGKGL